VEVSKVTDLSGHLAGSFSHSRKGSLLPKIGRNCFASLKKAAVFLKPAVLLTALTQLDVRRTEYFPPLNMFIRAGQP
jgi:hypothetical protein